MSNALFHTTSGHKGQPRLLQEMDAEQDTALACTPKSASAQAAALHDSHRDTSINPTTFLHEAMKSTRNLLALSTVARLIMDKERRRARPSAHRHTVLAGSHAEPGMTPAHDEAHFFSRVHTMFAADRESSPLPQLQTRIQELEASLQRIDATDLPVMTKDTVRTRIREQLTLLRESTYARHTFLCE